MAPTHAIFVFTHNRPRSLTDTLTSLKNSESQIVVMDDSSDEHARRDNQTLCKRANCEYFGRDESVTFLQDVCSHVSFLGEELGVTYWNLGSARNIALVIARQRKLDGVLFIDDDITVSDVGLVQRQFELLSEYDFVGAEISGMDDLSMIDTIAKSVGLIHPTLLSGGFLAFRLNAVREYFLNVYNEDWIWLYLQYAPGRLFTNGSVFQATTDRFACFERKAPFEEFGEITVDGMLEVFKDCSFRSLCNIEFWERIINERKQYLQEIDRLLPKLEAEKRIILDRVVGSSRRFTPNSFVDLFNGYFRNRESFRKFFATL